MAGQYSFRADPYSSRANPYPSRADPYSLGTDHYSFGVEIELLAKPRDRHTPIRQDTYFARFADALNAHGVPARGDDLRHTYRRHPEEYTRGWWITRDGSITTNESMVALEAVSRILSTRQNWENEIDKFWRAQDQVFVIPERSTDCGSHVHISSGTSKRWSDEQLRNIAVGVARYERYIQNMLPLTRRGNQYCIKNTASSSRLHTLCSGGDGWAGLINAVQACSRSELILLMQTDRKVLWNFIPAASDGVGTIEFRGGRHLRGPVRTKRWIAFAVSCVHCMLGMRACTRGRFPDIHSTYDLYQEIRRSAAELDLRQYLPRDYKVLSETRQQSQRLPPPVTSSSLPLYPTEPPPAYTRRYREPPHPPRLPPRRTEPVTRSNDADGGRDRLSKLFYGLVRLLQILLAMAVLGMYGHQGQHVWEAGGSIHIRVGFAGATSGLSILVALVSLYLLLYRWDQESGVKVGEYRWPVDTFLMVVWIVVFADSKVAYLATNPVMAHAVWLDLCNLILWFGTALYCVGVFLLCSW